MFIDLKILQFIYDFIHTKPFLLSLVLVHFFVNGHHNIFCAYIYITFIHYIYRMSFIIQKFYWEKSQFRMVVLSVRVCLLFSTVYKTYISNKVLYEIQQHSVSNSFPMWSLTIIDRNWGRFLWFNYNILLELRTLHWQCFVHPNNHLPHIIYKVCTYKMAASPAFF